jgi:hypothetical protein
MELLSVTDLKYESHDQEIRSFGLFFVANC